MQKRNSKGQFIKGMTPWNKGLPPEKHHNWGKHLSKETREKIRKANTGKSGTRRGVVLTEETKRKMSLAAMGKKNHQYGKPGYWKGKKRGKMPVEWRKKISETHLKQVAYNYKGTTKLFERIRKSFKYRQWRSDVFTRDDFTCQECGERGCYIVAHHIYRFARIMEDYKIKTFEEAMNCEELWNINNGLTLCLDCHEEIPKK